MKTLLQSVVYRFAVLFFACVLVSNQTVWADEAQDAKDELIIQTLMRLDSFDVNANVKVKEAVHRYLKKVGGTPKYLEIAKKLKIEGINDELLKMALDKPGDSLGVEAAALLLDSGGRKLVSEVAQGDKDEPAANMLQVLGLVGNKATVELLLPLVSDNGLSAARRNAAASAIGKNRLGQLGLLELVTTGKLPADVRLVTANMLHGSSDPKIREQIGKLIPLPQTAGSEPLPPIGELVKLQGDHQAGLAMFKGKATCIKCHKVLGEGKEVGPDLSEIGSKLSKEAMYVSILDPSAGVSHNYETYSAILISGNIFTGILVSETAESVTIKTAEAITKTIARDDIDELIKQKISLMPADMQKLMTKDDLVNVVEFLATLKKKS